MSRNFSHKAINDSEGCYAVVYPYVEGMTFGEYFGRYKDKPLNSYILELLDKAIKVSEIAAFWRHMLYRQEVI